ncbi:DBH-like monooxygenase protein 1 isoform X2 [Branchiostoma lanceolatum]|uniref:DBH-like monooxygenase protein 1 isoform X2 n=1 Tax=Branchiostoma lanceolatum TaxID=7740 RepID=UPI0034545C83
MAAFWISFWVVAAVTVMSANCVETTFTHSAYLDAAHEKYFLQWRYDADTITFRVEVATLGYVGFGISPNGDMTGSDIVTGFVTDQGETFFYDRYATAKDTPTIDASQDWTLEASGENGTHTFLQFSRNLVLCDDTDRTIKAGTTRVIWAYHEEDPRHDTELMYHGGTRGARSLMLLSVPQYINHVYSLFRQAGTTRVIWAYHEEDPRHDTELMYHGGTRGARSLMLLSVPQDIKLPENVQSIYLLNTYNVLKRETIYWYRGFKVPDLGGKRHIVAFEPVVQAGSEGMVHHMDLYACLEDLDADLYDGAQHARHSHDYPRDWISCKITLVAWEVGGEGFHYPKNVGISIGGPGDPNFILMQTHYNNPQRKTGMVDRSGFRLLYTSDLREHDMGFMQLGVDIASQIIPPGSQAFLMAGTCYPDCLEKAMEEESIEKINVVGVHFHAHLAGRKMRMRHVRNGVELPWLGNDENFDFNFQQTVRLQREVEVLKGDYLILECTYNTEDRRETTLGGFSTHDEMCLGHILHYPNMKLRRCKSNPHRVAYLAALGATGFTFRGAKHDFVPTSPPRLAGKSIKKLLNHYVTWNEELKQKFQEVQRTGNTSVICMKTNSSLEEYRQQRVIMREPPPVILHPYGETDVCKTPGMGAKGTKMHKGLKKHINYKANAENKSGRKKGPWWKNRKNHRKLNLSPWQHHSGARKTGW